MRSFASLYIYLALKVYILTINIRAIKVLFASDMLIFKHQNDILLKYI
jgi:hypothetical protein